MPPLFLQHILRAIISLLLIVISSAWNIALEVTTQVDGAQGGEPFSTQPSVIVNNKKGEHQPSFEGRVAVQLNQYPNETFEPVWKEGLPVPTSIVDTHVSQDVIDGRVDFNGLGVNAAGNYQLKFTLYDEHDLIMATAIGDNFTVSVGEMHQLGIITHPESAFGGTEFGIQPILSVQDRGGNTVESINEGMVTVSLQNGPDGASLRCLNTEGFDVPIKDGLAAFKGLFLDDAAMEYSLHFSTDLNLEGERQLTSNTFSVGIGPAAQIDIVRDVSHGSAVGGKAFFSQPRVEVKDAGGNVLKFDSSSAVRISIYYNPSQGRISPSDHTTAFLEQGVVQFRRLAIDKAGYGYRLKYEFLQFDGTSLEETSIGTLGAYFNVDIGPPHRLSILQHASGGWAGNQPFHIQPKVALVDAGGNVVSSDSTSIVTAHLTPSLAYDSKVIINTANDATPSIILAEFEQGIKEDGRTLYGPGDVIHIDVIFDQEVAMFPSVDNGTLPRLMLNSAGAYAELVDESPHGLLSSKLCFEYLVQEGHSQLELDYLSSETSLVPNDYTIEDAFGRNANLVLPALGLGSSLSASKKIEISHKRPIITNIDVDVLSGEYGAGQVINFSVSFDRQVVVSGIPLLPLNAPMPAIYTHGSGTATLHFEFRVIEGDNLDRLDVSTQADASLMLPLPHEDTITLLTNGASSSPVTADLAYGAISLPDSLDIAIDTTPPTVISISPQALTTPDGTYAVGDVLTFQVIFDKPVDVNKGLELTLSNGGIAHYVSGSGTEALLLEYAVKEDDDTSPNLGFFDTRSLVAQNTEGGRVPVAGYVRRVSSNPTTDAILDLDSVPNFADDHAIQIDVERPRILSVSFDNSDEGRELIQGDLLTILMQFSAPVVVKESSSPLLGLLIDKKKRWATYLSGSGSSILKFSYQVSIGDDLQSPLDFKYTRICTGGRDCINTGGLVVRLSEKLTLDANLGIGFADEGLSIADSHESGITIDTSHAPASTVVAVTTSKVSGTYGVGEMFDLNVEFSDQVFLSGDLPVLRLNTNSEAVYHTGNETDTLVFRYITTSMNSIHRLDWSLYPESDSPIGCSEECVMENANEVAVDTTFRDAGGNILVEPLRPDITLDPSPPQIVSVETDKTASPYCHPLCSYTVGEEVRISVTFDKPVAVTGEQIYIAMDVTDDITDNSNRAFFLPEESSSLQLMFLFTVGPNHTSHGKGLAYVCDDSNCGLRLSQAATIKRASATPTVDAKLALPPLPDHGVSIDESNLIIVDTSGPPTVTSVSSSTPNGQYSPGDMIEIAVLFNKSVVVIGQPFLTLDVGLVSGEAGIARYKSGSGSSTLYFEYKVGDDNLSLDLDYIDAYSLNAGFDGVHLGSINQASTNPTVNANIELPVPGTAGSLGFNSDIKLDSRRPYISQISATSGEYATGDEIFIQVHFSRPVMINGNPSLLLETGSMDRVAEYKSHPNDHVIEFSYTVRLGDMSTSLNYWSSNDLLPSSKMSFLLKDGWIRLKSANPQLDADLHVNPVDGYLNGDVTRSVSDGVAKFRELKIGQRGSDFKIWFQSNPPDGGILETAETVKIDASIEYEVQGDPANRHEGDLYGSAIDLDGDLLAVGAPGKRNPSPEVQVVTVFSEALDEEHEIQIISTSVNVSEAIRTSQEFSTCADPDELIRGTFQLTYIVADNYTYASSIELDADVSAEQLRTFLEDKLNLRGVVHTSRSSNPTCDSQNGWTWNVTFLDSTNGVGILKTDGHSLIGEGANISETVTTRQTDMLEGSFILVNSINGLSSRALPHNAPSNTFKDAIEEDLAISVKSVLTEDIHEIPELGRRWTIVFSHHVGEHGRDVNIPLLQVIDDNLQGKDAQVWTHTGFEGRGILNGTFALSFRDSSPSHFVSHNSSETDMKAALESLDSINEVQITNRREFYNEAGKSGFSWIVTFVSINERTDYGWVLDPEGSSSHGNLPSLKIVSHLTGWNVGHEVRSETGTGKGDTQAQWMEQIMGDDGRDSGSVDVYRRVRETWQKESSLLASDFDSKDMFGSSVSVKDDFLLVGAPSKQVNGLPEQQTITCNGPAADGFFILTFRGFQSSPIPHSATLPEIQKLIEGMYGETSQLHSMPRLLLSSSSEQWDGLSTGFCDGEGDRSITITFLTPDGGGISTFERRSGDLEYLLVDSSTLVDASITVTESRSGTNSPMGKDTSHSHPTGKQAGSVYLFQRNQACNICSPIWTQIMKFTPLTGADHPTDAARFGHSVIFVPETDSSAALAVVGSPGYNHESGKVYIFHHSQASWMLFDSLNDSNWNHDDIKGGRFGSSIHVDGDTILVGSPGYSNGRGAVYVFRRSHDGKHFLASQAIYGPNDVEEGDNFGHSLSLSEHKAAICAPYKSVEAIQVLGEPKLTPSAGACYVYSRKHEASTFHFDQQLLPSNVLPRDRFGWDVSISGSQLIVGQVEKSEEKLRPPRPVQVIQTYCDENETTCEGSERSKFKLHWSDGNVLHETQYLSASMSANQLRDAIENYLNLGDVTVDRSILPDKDGGYSWQVTFDSYKHFRNLKSLPMMKCEMLIESNLSCKVQIHTEFPRSLRSKAHLFDFDYESMTWEEQAFLFPAKSQAQDNLGSSVAIDGSFAAVGAPNREWLNINSGAAFLFDISFLNFRFTNGPYTIVEGETKEIELERSHSDQLQLISLRTADRNAEDSFLFYVNDLFSLQSLEVSPHDFLLSSSTAFGRSQFYGSNEKCSRFIGGIYDFQGVSDYAPLQFEDVIMPGEESISTTFFTNKDNILEKPDEHTTVQVNLRGMFASPLGRLTTKVEIMGSNEDRSTHYQILGEDVPPRESARMGAAVAIDRKAGMLVVGSDKSSSIDEKGSPLKNVGSAQVFKRMLDGSWQFFQELKPPTATESVKADAKFGSSVAIHMPYGRDDITILVGAPGIATVYVFALQLSTSSFVAQASLSPHETATAPLSELRFGGPDAIALQGDMAFVGSSHMEAVYVFRRSHVNNEGYVHWDPYSILRSSDNDYDIFGHDFTVRHIHRQNFGVALSASGRSLLVGAPFADYGNRGSVDSRERFDTDGIHNRGLGKGIVYAFYSQPHTQIVTLQSDEIIASGSFRLKLINHRGVQDEDEAISGLIRHNASPDSFKLALEEIANLGEVDVEIDETFQNGSYTFSWRVTFISNFEDDHPLLVPLSKGSGCDDCDRLVVSVLSVVPPFLDVQITHSHQPYLEEFEMQPADVVSTDLFGASLSLDGPQAIIGSKQSAAKTRTVWDFETGDLQGWIATGDAFRYQPTFGDNSNFRPVYDGYGSEAAHPEGNPQTSHLVGNYYIGTFEKRPGNESDGYQTPSPEYGMGSTQGDEPTGTLTSEPFICLGDRISFRVGGGCNHLKVYVELLVDGYPSLRATGKCNEGMDAVHWDVSTFINRSCQIRIVDSGSKQWDHINVDHFDFDWEFGHEGCFSNNFGQCSVGGGALPKKNQLDKQHYTGREETPTSGAAYFFIRECPKKEFNDMSPSNSNCLWTEQERVVASDKRAGNLFGTSVDVDHEQGVAIVGSSSSPAYGYYNDPIFVHPHSNLTTVNMPIPENLQDLMRSGGTYSATGGNLRVIDYLIHQEHIPVQEQMRYTEQAGSTYVFKREPAEIGPSGEVLRKPFWKTTEDSKFAPPDIAARDHFGFSVAMDGSTAVVGAIGHDGFATNGGGAFLYDMDWIRVKFTKVEYIALEGSDHTVKIFLQRDLLWSNSTLTIGYSTSDLSAIGVDASKFDECLRSHVSQRDGCGDYEQAAGEVTFEEGEEHTYFKLRVMDDHCAERRLEYVQLNLHQLGGSPLRGENYRAQLRIDDDDWQDEQFSRNCTGGIR